MAGTLGVTETTGSELSQLIASEVHIQREITLKASAGDLKRGTVLEMVSVAGGEWQQLATVADARAILLEDVDDSAETQLVQAYFVGKYHYEDLIWPAGITTLDKRTAIVALQDRGIIMDEAILAIPTTTTTTTTTTTSSSSTSSTTS